MTDDQGLPAKFRERAEQLRAIAEATVDPAHRKVLIDCARDYQRLALRAEMVRAAVSEASKTEKPN